jgi:hypothetical protein
MLTSFSTRCLVTQIDLPPEPESATEVTPDRMKPSSLFAAIPDSVPDELFETLLQTAALKVERIVSAGQRTPPDE